MTARKENSYKLLWMLGAVMTLPMILLCGPFAGYVLGQYFFVKFFDMPSKWIPAFVILGLVASGMQTYRLIKRIKDSDNTETKS